MKNLVAYFSATGTTGRYARLLADALEAQVYEIKPETPYTAADLDWRDKNSRSTLEMNDKSHLPALADTAAPVEERDTVFLGFPIWWYTAPTIINSFLKSYDFSGKKIVLFATSGGSAFGKTAEDLAPCAPGARITEGKVLTKMSEEEIKTWAESFK